MQILAGAKRVRAKKERAACKYAGTVSTATLTQYWTLMQKRHMRKRHAFQKISRIPNAPGPEDTNQGRRQVRRCQEGRRRPDASFGEAGRIGQGSARGAGRRQPTLHGVEAEEDARYAGGFCDRSEFTQRRENNYLVLYFF